MKTRTFLLAVWLGFLTGCKNKEVKPEEEPPSSGEIGPVKIVKPEEPEVKAVGAPLYFENEALRLEADSQQGNVYSGNVKVEFKAGWYGAKEGKLSVAKADKLTLGDKDVLLEGNAQLQRGDNILEGPTILIPKTGDTTVDGGASLKILRVRDSASRD